MLRRAPMLAVLLICASGASADNPVSATNCHAIADSMERLACYDAATGRNATQPVEPKANDAKLTEISPETAPERALALAISEPAGVLSMIDRGWDFAEDSPRYTLGFYQANYLLFGRYSTRVNNAPFTPIFDAVGIPPQDLDNTEAKFQLSFKARVWATDDRRFGVWTSYTQQSSWQVYNDEGLASRPFRETNYEPEVFVSFRPGVELPFGFQWNLLNAGYNHESNGRSDPLSRSWDRLFAEFGVERGNLAVFARAWYRIEESDSRDDNPDITDYLGHGDINALYRWRGHSFQLGGRANFSEGHGAVQFGWTSPPLLGPFRGYVQVFSGYGESMIDYNWNQTTIGAGIALSDGL